MSSDWTRRLKSSNVTPEKQRNPQQAVSRTGKKLGGSNSVNYSPAKLPKLEKPSQAQALKKYKYTNNDTQKQIKAASAFSSAIFKMR